MAGWGIAGGDEVTADGVGLSAFESAELKSSRDERVLEQAKPPPVPVRQVRGQIDLPAVQHVDDGGISSPVDDQHELAAGCRPEEDPARPAPSTSAVKTGSVSAPSCQSVRSLSTLLPRRLLQGPHVLVMTRPPMLAGGTCSSSVAAAPQIGQSSKKRGLMRLIGVIRTGRPPVEDACVNASERPSGRSIAMDRGNRAGTSSTYRRLWLRPSIKGLLASAPQPRERPSLTAKDYRSHGTQTERAARWPAFPQVSAPSAQMS